ncbi:hypothetical protein D030_3347B, partial [Vibrio parahaemolyticus AQ3810]
RTAATLYANLAKLDADFRFFVIWIVLLCLLPSLFNRNCVGRQTERGSQQCKGDC